jgi:diguanylate cyclase (GGDEF)-like protein
LLKWSNGKSWLIFFDLDKFKHINDTHGHAEGDRALKTFADQMTESFRTSDIFARLGGDEFAVMLGNGAETVIEELVTRFDSHLQARCARLGLPYAIQFSYGVVDIDLLRHATVEDAMLEADSAMYAQKLSRRQSTPG